MMHLNRDQKWFTIHIVMMMCIDFQTMVITIYINLILIQIKQIGIEEVIIEICLSNPIHNRCDPLPEAAT